MKKLFFSIALPFLMVSLSAQTCHFQQGFESTSPAGWVRNCGGTTGLNHGLYNGSGAAKFDNTTTGQGKQLESPAVNGAGTLTFWASRNANAVYFDLHVCKIVNGTVTEISVVSNTDIPHKNTGWREFSILVNEPSNNVKIMIWAEDKDASESFVAIDDIALTVYDGSGVEEPAAGQRKAYDNIVTDFGDGSWGTVADALPSSGSYPTSDTINDFVLNKAIVYKGSTTDASGEKHTNRICIDKKTTGGNLELPWLKTVGQVEIHAAVGTAGNTFTVDEYENNLWKVLETFSAIKTDSTFYLNIERDDTTRLRISNNSGGSVVIWKVLTRSRDEVRNLNVVSSTPAQNAVCFYNLTKEVKITFNKELVFGTGTIQLNDVAIPLSSCTIDEKTLIVPVTLESTQGRNKSYSLTIPAGALAEKNSAENLNQEYILNFQTLRKPSMPANYQEIIDIHYSGASEEMCRMDFYYPAGAAEATPVLINMHGGGWNHGAKEEQTGFGSFFSMGFAVANVEYRMTPQATAPAAVEDVRCAMQYLLKNAEALNIDPRKIVFQGSSAGGHLALTAGYLQNNRLYDTNCNDYKGEIKVLAVIDKYGPAKLEDFMFYTSLVNWLGEHAGDDEFVKTVSPYHLVDGNTPPTYIVHGDADPTVPYAQSVSLSGTLETNNVYHQFTTIPGGGHGGFEAQYNTQISNEITAFLNYLLGQVASSGSIEMKKKVQPRVVDNIICFNTNEEISFEVFDAQGRKIGKSNDNSFTLEHNGMFIIKAGTGDWKQAFKIIK